MIWRSVFTARPMRRAPEPQAQPWRLMRSFSPAAEAQSGFAEEASDFGRGSAFAAKGVRKKWLSLPGQKEVRKGQKKCLELKIFRLKS